MILLSSLYTISSKLFMDYLKKELSIRWVFVACLLISFLLYGNTLFNKYCLDDSMVITQNKFTQKGLAGIADIFTTESFTGFFGEQKQLIAGARYRPLSIATFAIEYEFLGKNPAFSHLLNLLLYALTAFLLFMVLRKVLGSTTQFGFLLAFLTSVLFLFHPIHTEVVANIKGRDEILALLFSLWSAWFFVQYVLTSKAKFLLFGGIAFLLGLFSKENAFVFIVIVPLFLAFLQGFSLKKMTKPAVVLLLAGLVFIIIRHIVIGGFQFIESNELMNNPFLDASVQSKFATIFLTLGLYLKLLVFPHPLTFDYYPYHISLVNWNSVWPGVILIFYFLLAIVALRFLWKRNIISLSMAIYLVALLPVSNLFFSIGTFLNERFLYISSVGFCLLLAYGFVHLISVQKLRRIPIFLIPVVLILSATKTISRNNVWFNDYTLFTTDVKTSQNSAKSNCSAGGALVESTDTIRDAGRKKLVLKQAITYLSKSVSIHPTYADAWILLGNAWFKVGNFDSSFLSYTAVLKLNRQNSIALQNILAVSEHVKEIDKKIDILKYLLAYDTANYRVYYNLGKLYGREKGDLNLSVAYLLKAKDLNPQSKEIFMDLGVAYGLRNEFDKSVLMLENATHIDPSDASLFRNLGLSYQFLGEMEKARRNFAIADSMSNSKK